MADPIIGKISVGDGATFTPSLTGDVLSWTNNKNLPNPASIDIVGATFTPSVSNAGVLSWGNNKGLPNPASVDMAQAVVDKKPGWGIPLGYEYFTFNPNIPQGALPLFGGEYSRATYSDLWAWVQQQTGYLKTEAEWQTLSTSNNGNVPYYSDGDGSTTFRVPSLKCWVKAADGTVTDVGSYKAAGLPNITGYFGFRKYATDGRPIMYNNAGAFFKGADINNPSGPMAAASGTFNLDNLSIDASRSSSIYGNSTTVQPESVVGLWLVQAYGVVVDTGSINEQQYIDDRMATRLPLAGGTMTGNIAWAQGEVGYRPTTHTSPYDPCRQMIVTAGTVDSEWNDGNAKLALHTYDSAGVNTAENGAFVLQASDGTNAPYLEGKPNGSLTWAGKEVVAKKDETISFTMTASNGTVGSLSAHKVGNIVCVNFAITPSSSVTVGNSITGTFSGLPSNVNGTSVNSASYVGATALILSATSTNYTIRVTGATLGAGSGFGFYFIYPTVN